MLQSPPNTGTSQRSHKTSQIEFKANLDCPEEIKSLGVVESVTFGFLSVSLCSVKTYKDSSDVQSREFEM